MKRYMIFFAICSCLMSCEVESADKPTRERYSLESYAAESAEGRVVFPLAMMETALNIEAYENAAPEEKVKMTYIFNSLLSQEDGYVMKNFHSFHLTPDEKSIYEPGASWKIFARNDMFYPPYPTGLTLNCVEDGKWKMVAKYENGTIEFDIVHLPQEDTFFNWQVQLSGTLTSVQGRVLTISSQDVISRRVYVDKWGSETSMEGTLKFSIYDKDTVTLLDEIDGVFDPAQAPNTYYDLCL